MKLKWFTHSLVFNAVLCWLIMLRPAFPSELLSVPGPGEETCDLHDCPDDIELDGNGNVIKVTDCRGNDKTPNNAGSTSNQNTGGSPGSSAGSSNDPTISYAEPSSFCWSCGMTDSGGLQHASDIYQPSQGWDIATASSLAYPDDPLIFTPPQAYSAPQYTPSPSLVQSVALGDDFWGVPLGDLVVTADPNSTAPISVTDVRMILKRAAGIMDISPEFASTAAGVDQNGDPMPEHVECTYETPTAYFVVQSNFAGSTHLTIFGYDLSATFLDENNQRQIMANAPMFLNLTFSRVQVDGQPGIQIDGYQSNGDGSNAKTVHLAYTSLHAPGTGSSQTVVENGIRTTISDSYGQAADDADGWHHIKSTVVSKPGTEAGQWVEWRNTTQVWRTLLNGREMLVESTTSEDGGAARTTRFYYEEEFAFGGIRNKAFGKLRAKVLPDGSWEAYEYDFATGLPYRTYKPWMDSPLPPMTGATAEESAPPLANYFSSCKVEENTFVDLEFTSSQQAVYVSASSIYWTQTTFSQDESYSDAALNQLWTKEVYDSETNETTYTTFLRDPDGYRKILSRKNAAGVETRYAEQKGTVSVDGLTFTEDSAGNRTADITTGPIAPDGTAVAGKTKRSVSVKQVNGSTVLSYTEVATVSGPLASAAFQRVEGRTYSYDAQYRLTGVYLLDGTPVETHAYTATSHTVTDAEGIVTVTELDATTGRELAVVKSAASHTVGGVTYQAPHLRDTAAVADDAEGNVVETQSRTGTQTGQTAIAASHSITRNALGQIIAKTDHSGRTTAYSYEEDGRKIIETLPGGATRIRQQYVDRQLKSITGTAGVAEYYSYSPAPSAVETRTDFGQSIDSRVVRVSRRRYPGGGMLYEMMFTKHPVTDAWLMASSINHEFAEYESRLSARFNANGVQERMKYNELGELEASGIDVNQNGTLDASGTDTYAETKSSTVFEDNAWWEKSITRRLSVDGDATTALTTTTWRKLGTGAASYMRTLQPDGTEIVISSSIDRAHAARTVTQTVTRPGGGTPLVSTQLYVNGLLMSETQPGISGAITHTYDGLERRVSTTDPRSGTVQWNYLPDGRLNWTKDAGNRQTSYAYYPVNGPQVGRLQTVTHPDNTTTTYEYDLVGRVTLQSGTSGYPVGYEYDEWGKMKKMKTWRDPQGDPDVTTWVNDPVLGVLEKTDAANETVRYSYLPGGALHTRTWARNVTTTYGHDNAGRLNSVDYSDATPDVSTTYDRLGRPVTITDGSGSRTQTYDGPGGAWDKLTYAADSTLGAVSVERGFDAQMREDELQVVQGGQAIASTGLGYHEATGRIGSITHGGSTATYDWTSTVAGLPVGISYSGAGLVGTRTPDAEGRLDKISWSIGNANVLSHDYTLDSRGRREKAEREDGTHWDYGYNDRGEVTSASHERSDNTPLPGRGFGYTFDAIGNRTTATVAPHSNGVQATTYTPNALNQYTHITRTNPLQRIVQGLAHPDATIEVRHDSPTGQSRTVARVEPNGAGFIAEAEADTALAGVWRQVVVDAQRAGVGVNGGPVRTRRKGWLFFPPQNETLVYDEDGNLKEDARWLYTWDGENRLIAMEEKAIANATPNETPPPRKRLEFAYDGQSRRVRKVVKTLQGQTWSVTSDVRFVYDAWNLLAEFSMKLETSNLELQRSYAWGYDLSGTEQGAGGVGGLVLVKQSQTTAKYSQPPPTGALAPLYDGNGNILAYIDCTTGTVTQTMEYDAFGNEMTLDSVLEGGSRTIREVPFRFSTKFTDSETSLSYYGYRYYSAEIGRWLNRDPIEERGGLNLHASVQNDMINRLDVLGNSGWQLTDLFGRPFGAPHRPNGAEGGSDGDCLDHASAAEERHFFGVTDPYDGAFRHCVAACCTSRRYTPIGGWVCVKLWDLLHEDPNSANSRTDMQGERDGLSASTRAGAGSCENECLKKYPRLIP